MAQLRPISTHPAFVPLAALWFAALLGLGVAVLPADLLERALGAMGLGALLPLALPGRLIASAVAAVMGALIGLALAMPAARRARDPRPIYEDAYAAEEMAAAEVPSRRPLRVREELDEGFAERGAAEPEWEPRAAAETQPAVEPEPAVEAPLAPVANIAEAEEGFMILSPQPVHPQRAKPDLDALLAQFDTALATFRSGEEARPAPAAPGEAGSDPVHAFVARQTGAPAPYRSPLAVRVPDHQAELRAALDKLAKAHRKD